MVDFIAWFFITNTREAFNDLRGGGTKICNSIDLQTSFIVSPCVSPRFRRAHLRFVEGRSSQERVHREFDVLSPLSKGVVHLRN